tara:strand:+ start:645 stop:1538 length:894 start_codon:yes stop_codon:yes gene_type:complete
MFGKTFKNLFKTKNKIRETFNKVLKIRNLSDSDLETVEESLLSADINWEITEKVISEIKADSFKNNNWEENLHRIFNDIICQAPSYKLKKIILMIGVNGVGKTTVSAKLSNFLKKKGKKITLVAADTYRAAAVSQLKLWSDKIGIDIIYNKKTTDPASIAYDGVNSGLSKKSDYIIIDSAGRLQNSINLMNELSKIYKVISKLTDEISVIINLDCNIGQNSISQVEEFNKFLPIDAIILNKIDGTARGGIAISIIDKFKLPILFLGIGEKIDDISPFEASSYIDALIKTENYKEKIE